MMVFMKELKQILTDQLSSFTYFFSHVDLAMSQKVCDMCKQCQGLLYFTGVGKSGYIAKKLAMTFSATGTRALFLDPIGAMHGDFGLLRKNDLVIVLSKSGKSQELYPLLELFGKEKIDFMAWLCDAGAKIMGAKINHILPLNKEICPFKKAPLTSSVLQLTFGNCLAALLMQNKGFSLDRYSINHCGGSIGKELKRVDEVMVKDSDLPLANAKDTLEKKLVELSAKKLGTLLVVDKDNMLLGIFTDGDLRRCIEKYRGDFLHKPLEELMTKDPRVIASGSFIHEALEAMHKSGQSIMALPVVSGRTLVGLIHKHQISCINMPKIVWQR